MGRARSRPRNGFEAARILLEGGRSYAELDLEERLRYALRIRAILYQHEDDFVQVKEGLIGASKLGRQRRAVAEALTEPAARGWWTENAHLFSQGFQDYVASVLAT